MNILVIAAHPDDEVLGAGGTIANHSLKGDQVTIAILGEGITSRSLSRQEADKNMLNNLEIDAVKAAKMVGCENVRLLGLPDNRFDSLDLLDVVKKIESLVTQVEPQIIYTHHFGDLNMDHVITARAVMTACRPLPGSIVQRILAFEVPSSTGWGFSDHVFSPTVFVNIDQTLSMKLNAMQSYTSELREYPHPRSLKSLEDRARTWGSQVGMVAAEPFVLLREIIK